MTDSVGIVLERYPNRPIDRDSFAFYEGWLGRRLTFPKCASCGLWHQPPRAICPFCWSSDLVPTPVTGKGVIYLSILLHQGPPADDVSYPYPVVTVELAEQPGLRYTSTLVGGGGRPAPIGALVELSWIERDGTPFPAFRLVEPTGAK
jgi:uncharacterized OB-fold protein